ncbi:ATP-dependent DNA ligase [Pseudarthrobacter sp. MM222]|uniref:ATP-dependent DNA ligase n=1 Tax=Pseudarthrobacter sp. MM222 TaxID=3018929 RepID=UPI003FA7D80E
MPDVSAVIPSGLRPPLEVALAKAVRNVAAVGSLPAPVCFEPKWDGYRTQIFREKGRTSLWSRQGKDLTRYSVRLSTTRDDFSLVKGQLVVRDRCRPLIAQLVH